MRTLGTLVIGLLLGAMGLLAVQAMETQPNTPVVDSRALTRGDVVMTLRNDYLSRIAAQEIQRWRLPIDLQDVRLVSRTGNQLALAARVEAYGISLPATVTMLPSVEQGRLRVTVTRVDVESIPIPGDLGKTIEEALNAELDKIQRTIPFRLTGVRVSDEGLVLEGLDSR